MWMSKDAKDSGIVPTVEEIKLGAASTLSDNTDEASKWSQESGKELFLQGDFPGRITPMNSPQGFEVSEEV